MLSPTVAGHVAQRWDAGSRSASNSAVDSIEWTGRSMILNALDVRTNHDSFVAVQVRFYVDSESGSPHIHRHGVEETEVEEILGRPEEDRRGHEGARVAIGQTRAGRYLRVVYVPDPVPDSVFVITAYELRGKPLAAYRRRRRKKRT